MPDVKKTLFLIIASMLSYYEDDEKLPVTDKDMMREATPNEIGTALGTIIVLRSQFYHIPDGEPEDKKGTEGKTPDRPRHLPAARGRDRNTPP
jgi:hypothetical protein